VGWGVGNHKIINCFIIIIIIVSYWAIHSVFIKKDFVIY
jgi:hypothetical protein